MLRVLRGKDIQKDILSEYKIHISYQQAMKGRHYGIQQVRGSPYEAFEILPYYCYNLEKKNEGTVTRIKTDDNRVFEMLFIAIGASIRTFLNYLRPVLMIDDAHLKGLYKGTNLVAVAMDGNNQIVPIAFGICKGETALVVEKEFPLAFHAKRARVKVSGDVPCDGARWYYKRRQLAANMTYEITDWAANKVAKKRMKSATWVVNGVNAYQYDVSNDMVSYLKWKVPRQFTNLYYMLPPNYALSGMKQINNDYHTNVLYDIAKVVGKLHIFVAHTPIDLSTVLIPNDGSVEQSLAGVISEETKIKLEELLKYLQQMQQRKNKKFEYYGLWGELGFINKTKPHTPYTQAFFNFVVHNSGQLVLNETKNTMYINGGTFNINIPRMKLADLKQYLINILGTNIHALYYKIPHNEFSVVKLRNNYDMHVMFDICSSQYKLEIYIDHIGVNFVIHKYIFPNASLAEMTNHVITDYSSENEGLIRQETQNDYIFDQMVEWAEQEHFEYEETKVSCPKIDLSSMLIDKNRSKEESFGGIISEEQKRQQEE
nr:transposase, MuDR, MULE transposase domain protein [Tanacetum cinerariifolium]